MSLFLGNQQDPSLSAAIYDRTFSVYPSAFWLEPHWRDTAKFTVEWLLNAAVDRDIVLLVHPENVLADPNLVTDFRRLINTLGSSVLQ
jgi:hypothetical protein